MFTNQGGQKYQFFENCVYVIDDDFSLFIIKMFQFLKNYISSKVMTHVENSSDSR